MLSTIQDGGRRGFAFYGIPASGYMDRESAQIANLLVGNKKNAPLIEMTYIGAHFQFGEEALIALTGADMSVELNGSPVKSYRTLLAPKGGILRCKNAREGVRTYLAIGGKWEVPKYYGSAATYTYAGIGGLNGRALQKNDQIQIINRRKKERIIQWPKVPGFDRLDPLPLQKGPEFSFLQNLAQLLRPFSISPQNDRMGALLEGEAVAVDLPDNFPSQALFPGVVQCTPGGRLIVVLQDGQTTGGYPRVGIIPPGALWRFNQIRMGKPFSFQILD